ncbi:MAG: alpha/beta hydrolase [SAR86 cluster bacterium]|uniref:Alpha/beta hydrolase n=1 Tax=SAR86 cluster bacterium TaxID=2030880 RepID=A0A2A4MTN8_9GAMM|nr:MAG: alpha/beta hydrolase [SAR86 cluster bacterium]
MFSLSDAQRLRQELPPSGLSSNDNNSLIQNYLTHYGLADLAKTYSYGMGRFHSQNFELVCQSFSVPSTSRPPSATVFILHGYFDHTGNYSHLIKHCLDLHCNVVVFDLPGHGLSSGKPASIDSFDQYLQAFHDCIHFVEAQQLGSTKPWHLIGQSTGGAIAVDALLNSGQSQKFDKTILLAPLLRPKSWLLSKLQIKVLSLFTKSIARGFSNNSHDQNFLNFLRQEDSLQCTRLPIAWVEAMSAYIKKTESANSSQKQLEIIQGSDDGTVNWQHNLSKLKQLFPAANTTMIEGAKHHMANESPHYRDQVFARISEIISK